MGWQLLIGLGVLSAVAYLAWHLGIRRNVLTPDDATRILITVAVVAITALIVAGAQALGNRPAAIGSVLVSLLAVGILAYLWLPRLGSALLSPLTSAFDGGEEEVDPKPFYHRAAALRKQGKYQEALAEVQNQLERFPDDSEGFMLMAEIQSDDLRDVPAALGTLTAVVATPEHEDRDRILALNRMADLQLRIEDVPAAREVLQRIVTGWPETDSSRFAQQRLAHLPDPELLAARRDPAPLQLGNYQQNLGLVPTNEEQREPAQASPAQQASDLLKRLDEFPEDWEAREQLATLYGRHFKRFDLARDQIETLLATPGQPEKAMVRWLYLLADLQLEAPDGVNQCRGTLERIVKAFPNSPYAEAAGSRIARLGLENRAREAVRTVKLGTYEQNIGLKIKTPHEA